MSFDVDSFIAQSIKSIEQSKSGEDAFDALCMAAESIFSPIKLTMCFVGRVVVPKGLSVSPFFAYHKVPQGWEENYFKKGYITIDPQALQALRHTRPFYWSELDVDLTEAQLAMKADAASYGLVEGLVIPVHSRPGIAGALSFGADVDFRLTTLQHVCFEVLGRFTYEHIEDLLGAPKDIAQQALTERERDVVSLIAQGKTNWEIGAILEISEYSVRDHLKSVSKRLGTSNRTQTIVKSVQLGLIVP